MSTVLGTVYSVLGTVYSVLGTVYSVLGTVYSVLGTVFLTNLIVYNVDYKVIQKGCDLNYDSNPRITFCVDLFPPGFSIFIQN